MSIKKSSLEKKLLYRIAKVFFLILPLLVLVIVFLRGDITIVSIVYMGGGIILYYVLLNLVWRCFLYIAFGGLENDTKKPITERIQSINPVNQQRHRLVQATQGQNQTSSIVGIVAFVILITTMVTYSTNDSFLGISTKNTYGTPCSIEGKNGLYGTDGSCYTCSSGDVAVTSPVNNCSTGIAGVYCCNNSSGKTSGNSGSKCVPTGCGTQWDCWGDYYPPSGVQTHVSGCFPTNQSSLPSWSGTCRRCP